MSEALDDPAKPTHGSYAYEERSIPDPAIIGGALAFLGPPAAVALDYFLSGREHEAPPPEVELPPGVHSDED